MSDNISQARSGSGFRSDIVYYILGVLLFIILYDISLYDYFLSHSIAQIFSIAVAFGIFALVWNVQQFMEDSFFLVIGIAFVFIGLTDLFHSLTFKTLGATSLHNGSNISNQLHLSARFVQAATMCAAPYFLNRKVRISYILFSFFALLSFFYLSIFTFRIFPECYRELTGATLFQILSEYFIAAMFASAIYITWKKRSYFHSMIFRLITTSLFLTFVSQLGFAANTGNDLITISCHFLNIISILIIYKAVIEMNFTRPYEVLFMHLKESENQLRKERDVAQTYLDTSADVVIILDLNGKIRLINKNGSRILGYSESELIGKNWVESFVPEYLRDNIISTFKTLRTGGPDAIEYLEYPIVTSAGSLRIIAFHNSVLKDEAGQVTATLSCGNDITEKNMAEEALKKIKENLEFMVSERTSELAEANKKLNREITERREIETRMTIRNQLLKLLGDVHSRKEYLDEAVRIIMRFADVGCAGIRVLDENRKIPFASYHGFNSDFIEAENNITLDNSSCICTKLLNCKKGNNLPLLTPGGSFKTDNAAQFRDALSKQEQFEFMDACIKYGYASIAIIPIRFANKTIGALHLADKRENRMKEKLVEKMETITGLLGEGINKFKQEDNLRKANELLEKIFSGNNMMIAYMDTDFNFIRVNENYAAMYGNKAGYYVGKNHFDLFPDPEHKQLFERAVQTGDRIVVYEKPIVNEKKSGAGITYWDVSLQPVKNDAGKVDGLVLTLIDKTERRTARDKLLVKEKELIETKRLSDIGTLAATVAHELRNPLGVIRTAVYNVKKKSRDNNLESHLKNIEKKISESDQIINNLLNYSTIKKPHYERIRIYYILNELISFAKQKFEKMHITFTKDTERIRDHFIEADPFQMREVFNNIIDNACQSVDNGSGRIDISAWFDDRNSIVFKFSDNGAGIAQEDLKRVFEPFFTRKSKGTGLGLTICNELVNLHGGTIDIQSIENEGTTVTVKLPVKRSANEPENSNY
jgi:PAS domain S-box-containing protein